MHARTVQTPCALVITGPPGAGKTTVARLVAERSDGRSVHLHADDFWHHLVQGYVEPWLPESVQQNETVLRAVFAAMTAYASGGYFVVLDGVLGPWNLHLLREARPASLDVDYVVLRPSLEIAVSRMQARSGHPLQDETAVTQMHDEFVNRITQYEGHVLDTSTLTPEQVVGAISEGRRLGRFHLAG